VPRLTAVLRALATDAGRAFDADAAYIARAQALQQRQAAADAAGVAAGQQAGGSRLAQQLIGDWDKGEARRQGECSPELL
jgi:hypothetical protein